ncbi:uncharacterized protein LOC120155401 [Hibiscus syriacus]|uniref:uncharacterized protein LOC120155401 n=1 Tax=Hibiscus syriacus TaxID=106335 RepID=UPI0019226A8F|nr:uncharacterized protein LOC120155401 [Hibiscus syriacus]
MPPSYKFCNVFGHSVKGCKHNPNSQASTMAWRKKDTVTPATTVLEVVHPEGNQILKADGSNVSLIQSLEDNVTGNQIFIGAQHLVSDSDISGDSIKPDSPTVIIQGAYSDLNVNAEENPKLTDHPGSSADFILELNGRIWFLWRNGLDFSLCNETYQSITVKDRFKNVSFIITAIYVSNNSITRRQLWQELRHLDSNFSDIPWLLGGDFNDLQLHDHPYFGPTFSWRNKQSENYIARKLDRVLTNPIWFESFPHSSVEFLALGPSDHSQGNPMKSLFLKLKRLKVSLKQLNKDYFSDITARRELNSLQEVEAMFLKQKAKLHWLKEGDKCTKFFHSIIATKNKRQTIRVLVNNRGEKLESFDDTSLEILEYFKTLLGSKDPNVIEYPHTLLKDLIQPIPSFEESETLIKEVTSDEIREVIFSQGNEKAPSPDGFTALFFKKAWPVVGNDFIKAIKYFFQESYIYPAFNATVIALIPKKPNPSKVSDFRPISCCSEIVKGYGRKNISPRCALKIDLQKAFDSINWDFIQAVLKALDLPPLVIAWIVSCYTDAIYSISLNGRLVGYFKGAKGIRQGDPLSPTLFILVMNVHSNILNNAAIRWIFAFHPKCKKIRLTHLSFADDLLIFCKGNLEFIMGVITVLDCFYEYSGLKLNVSKCKIFTAGISAYNLDSIINYSGFKHGRLPVRYLGVLLVTRKLTDKDCQALLQNIKSRLHQWSTKKMSYAGSLYYLSPLSRRLNNYALDFSGKARTFLHLVQGKLLAGEGSLWVAWIHNYIIKQQDFFTMDEYPSATWSFRRMQKLRSVAQSLLITTTKSTKEIWEVIRHKDTKVHWHKLIWYPLHVPKYNIISWMVILNCLSTRDRLQRFRLVTSDLCIFCSDTKKTRDHLFTEHSKTTFIWRSILQLSDLNTHFSTWNNLLDWAIASWKGKSWISSILKLSWCSFNYTIWEERNRRIFRGSCRTEEGIVNAIKDIVGSILSNRDINRRDSRNLALCTHWGID